MIKKIYSFFLIILVLVTSPFLIRYLLTNQKITILNSIYFNFPGIITKNKICPTYDALLNKTLGTFIASAKRKMMSPLPNTSF